jgi:uncharacterized lipoprotein YddW (UPF0748 family)
VASGSFTNDIAVLRDRGRMQATVYQLAELGFNRLYAVVWNSGLTYYPSQVSQQRVLQDFTFRGLQGQDVIGELSEDWESLQRELDAG